jgi:hypothetical protein
MTVAFLAALALVQAAPIGSALGAGVELVYESGGVAQAPWVYDSVRVVARESFDRCVVTHRRSQPARESCVRGDTLFERGESNSYRAVRPIGPNMQLDVHTAAGSTLHYTTQALGVERVAGGLEVASLTTTIITRNASGTVTRRLRERYATALLTAVWGVFEEPDESGGWRTGAEFSLVDVRRPATAPDTGTAPPLSPTGASAQHVPIPATEQQWAALWERVNENPWYLGGLGREAGSAIVVAAVRTRPNGYLWAAMAGTICSVDAPTRMALTGSARLQEFGAARTCFERIDAALPVAPASPELDYVRSSLILSLAEVLLEAGELGPADSLAALELERGIGRAASSAGDIEYRMNQVRGRVALRRGRRHEAIEFLQRAGETRGSPVLVSFGPQLVLARELLEAAEVAPVRQFLSTLHRFWIGPDAEAFIADAIATIDSGAIPDGPRWR